MYIFGIQPETSKTFLNETMLIKISKSSTQKSYIHVAGGKRKNIMRINGGGINSLDTLEMW